VTQSLPEGTVTVLFTDVEKSTDLRTSRGDDTAHALLRAQSDLVRRQVQEHGGHEVKSMGDGFMIAFASARAAIDCAVGIQRGLHDANRSRASEDRIGVRMGLNTGEVIREDGDLFGEAVNAAARIMAKAGGGQILLSETVRAVLGRGGETPLLDRGRFRLKGFPERWRLFEVQWQTEEATAAHVSPVLAERTPYVGREEERAELRRLMEQAIAGRGSIVLIRGEPGVGKTRLAQELVLEARKHGMFDSTGRCYEMEGSPPYIPYIEMLQQSLRRGPAGFRTALGENAGEIAKILPELRQVFDDIPPPLELPPEQERLYLFNSIREFLERVSHTLPLLHILDDLHWADDATLMLLQHIAQHQDKMPVLTVATYRDIELDAARPFAQTLESLVRQRLAHRIALKPLPEAGVEAMLRALTAQPPPPALVQAIYRETEGNPFFVEEVFQHLSEQGRLLDAEGRWRSNLQVGELDVPEGVRLVISRRLERVSEDCRTALTDAAVVGRDFGFQMLQALTELGADRLLDAIDEAERANLIVASDDLPAAAADHTVEARFRFAHELIRQTLISALSLPRRQRLHLRVAETMEQVYGEGAEAYAADMAHHLYQAGAGAEPAKTARYLVLAGDQALHSAAFGQALRDYDMAVALQTADDRAARADLLYKRGLARRSLDRWDEALSDWREAATLYERLGDNEAAARTFESMCYQVLYGQHFAEALEISQRGLALIGRRESFYRSRLAGWGGMTLSSAGYYSAGDAMLRRAQELGVKLNDESLVGLGLAARAVHHWVYLEVREAAEAGLKAAELLRKTGLLWYLADTLFYTGVTLTFAGRPDEGAGVFRELTPLAERLGHTVWSGGDYDNLFALRTGDIDGFEAFWTQWLERARERKHAFWMSQSQLLLGMACFWRGRWQEALDSFQTASHLEPAGAFSGTAAACTLLVRAYTGDKEAALLPLGQKGAAAVRAAEGPSAASFLRPMLRAARSSGLGLKGLVGLIRESRAMAKRGPLPLPGRPASFGASTMLFAAVEGLAVLGERAEAAKLYPLVLERMQTGNLFRPIDSRLIDTLAGIAAGAGNNWAHAEEHFRSALRRAEELPNIIEQPEARRFYARMLLDRNAPGDREKARQLLTEAIEVYRRLSMPKHIEMAEALLAQAQTA
jgi:class 3 adenylate cyclase/tetratricopeptide (TPR) repeat protein